MRSRARLDKIARLLGSSYVWRNGLKVAAFFGAKPPLKTREGFAAAPCEAGGQVSASVLSASYVGDVS